MKTTHNLGCLLAGGILLLMVACQGRTTENMKPTGDTIEVKVVHPVERADSVLHSMDEEMIHGLDNETVMTTTRI